MDTNPQVVKEITQLADKWADAQVRGDAAAAIQILADRFLYTSRSGDSISRDEWLSYIPKAKIAKFERSEPDVLVVGDTAVLSGIVDYDTSIDDVRIVDKCRYAVTFAKTGGAWNAIYAHFTPIS